MDYFVRLFVRIGVHTVQSMDSVNYELNGPSYFSISFLLRYVTTLSMTLCEYD